MTHRVSRSTIVGLGSFIGLTAVVSAVVVVPALPPEWLGSGPFTDYTLPAIALGAVGLIAMAAAVAAVLRPASAGPLAMLAGAMMVTFELVQIAVIGLAIAEYGIDRLDAWLQIVYIAAGSVLAAAGESLWRTTQADRTRTAPADRPSGPRVADTRSA